MVGNFNSLEIEATSRLLRSLASVIRYIYHVYSFDSTQQRALDIPCKGSASKSVSKESKHWKSFTDPPCRRIGNRL